MATTSIWTIKNNLKNSINYIINPQKTLNKDYDKDDYNYLENNSDYNFKQEKICYVTCLNCFEDNPCEDMELTKKRFLKKDGILAYHGYQSFKEGEVSPDIAHEIGVKLAEEMFKDYEVVVATHQNTNHIHNHFIVNSVSFLTGKKFNNNHTNIAKLRNISDSLCSEYGLSILAENEHFKKTYNKSISNDDYYKTLKEDLDNVISYSVTLKQLFYRMRELGYKVYSRNDIITIYRDDEDKVRIEKTFGKEYSKDRISERLCYSRQIAFKPMSQKSIFEEYSKTNKHHKGIYGLYLYYCYLLDIFPKKYPKQYLPYSIRKEVYKLEQISKQIIFMNDKNIVTKDDLDNFTKNNYEKLSLLVGTRENLWRRYHRAKSDEKKNEILVEINDIKPKIIELRKYDKYCKEIAKRSEIIQNNLNNFDKDIQKEKENFKESQNPR